MSILIISNLHIDDNRKYSIVQNPQNQSGNSIEGAAVNAKNQKEFLDTNANWMAAIQQNISQQEYHIHYDSVENAYQCPNRKIISGLIFVRENLVCKTEKIQQVMAGN